MKTEKEIMEELARWKEEDKEGRGFLIIMVDEKKDNVATNVNLPATYIRAAINHLMAVLQEACKETADRIVDNAKRMML